MKLYLASPFFNEEELKYYRRAVENCAYLVMMFLFRKSMLSKEPGKCPMKNGLIKFMEWMFVR